ncbi:MAG: hypothetical protein O2892_03100 [Actinomycetota bacterium]|nr:hypothetical protein [Actinomycetota bacterium]
MATRTRPFLMTGAALASAVAVVAATPSIMPSVAMPAPTALSSAAYDLTTFADLLSITPEDISNAYFGGWGFALKPFDETDPDPDWEAAYLSPFIGCNEDCAVAGVSGVAYLLLDALINGNGEGYEDSSNWSVSALNYAFEGGPGPAALYLAIGPFANPASPLYNPAVVSAILLAGQGLNSFSLIYIQALDTVSKLAAEVPLLGPYIYGAIQAYLGPNTSDEFFGDWGYFAGLSGVLRYVTDVVLTGGNPLPPYGPPVTEPVESAASILAVAAEPAAAEADPAAVEPAVEVPAVADSAPAAEVVESTPAAEVAEVAETTPVVEVAEVAETTPVTEVAETTPVAEVAEVVESTPAADITPVEVESTDATPAAVDTPAEAAPAAATPAKEAKRPVRGALQRAAKSIGSALKAAPAAKAEAAADAD